MPNDGDLELQYAGYTPFGDTFITVGGGSSSTQTDAVYQVGWSGWENLLQYHLSPILVRLHSGGLDSEGGDPPGEAQ